MEIQKKFQEIDRIAFILERKIWTTLLQDLDPPIKPHQYLLLTFIKRQGTCIATDIAKNLDVTLSAITGLVNKLVDMGLVTRVRSEENRRIVLIGLTDKGTEVIDKVNENKKEFFLKYATVLTEDEINMFFKVINKLNNAILEDIHDQNK
ncbi:MAG: MarR family transcriptional regulator [Clostridiaceae bacterium]|nr:MarR family transcriptional regulator [Clostridiaceae bacterium]